MKSIYKNEVEEIFTYGNIIIHLIDGKAPIIWIKVEKSEENQTKIVNLIQKTLMGFKVHEIRNSEYQVYKLVLREGNILEHIQKIEATFYPQYWEEKELRSRVNLLTQKEVRLKNRKELYFKKINDCMKSEDFIQLFTQ